MSEGGKVKAEERIFTSSKAPQKEQVIYSWAAKEKLACPEGRKHQRKKINIRAE